MYAISRYHLLRLLQSRVSPGLFFQLSFVSLCSQALCQMSFISYRQHAATVQTRCCYTSGSSPARASHVPLFAGKCCGIESSVCEVTMPMVVKGPLLVLFISCVVQIPSMEIHLVQRL
mmetsp:Transcript_28841/g.52173  ORF Transcript_28841/g.52173 Transcript_28841/m.52173 type:complete len:118 (+) Transcript_28841:42-395(+)